MSADLDSRFTHHKADVNGVRLHYVIGGQGDPVVLLHGWPETWYAWRHVMPLLVNDFTVIVPDLRGLGDSAKPIGGYDKRTLAEDIHELVTTHLDLGRVFIAGNDWGGSVAYAYAQAWPDEVRALSLTETNIAAVCLEEYYELTRDGGIWHFAFHMSDMAEALVTGRERLYIRWFLRNYAYNPDTWSEADIDVYAAAFQHPGTLRAGMQYYRTLWDDYDYNVARLDQRLTMPIYAAGSPICLGGDLRRTAQGRRRCARRAHP